MIQTKTAFLYDNITDALGKIKIEIESYSFDNLGKQFNVNHWAIDEFGNKIHKLSQRRFRSHEQLEQLETYINANFDFTGLTLKEKEFKKMKIGLLMDVQTNLFENGMTVWKLQPNDWEFSPEEVI